VMYMLCVLTETNDQQSKLIYSPLLIIQHLITGTASEMCIYTNDQFLVEAMDVEEEKSEDVKE